MSFTTDLGKILNKLTPDAPLSSTQYFNIEEKVLLWTNSSSSTFVAQPVALSLTDYDAVIISYEVSNSSYSEQIAEKGINTGLSSLYLLASNQPIYMCVRSADVNDTSVSFGDGYISTGGTPWANNAFMIPREIYGIKKLGGGV